MDDITSILFNLDFHPIQRFTTPNGTVWRVFAAEDEDSLWHEEPVCWEILVAEITEEAAAPSLFYVCGTLLSPGVFVRTEREWAAALERLLPRGAGWEETAMEEVD
jgi:hypothetical protein